MGMKGRLIALTAALAAMGEVILHNSSSPKVRVEPDTEGQKFRREKAYQELMRDKGLKWFNIDGVEVLALNKKNAIRKSKKLKS